jgi:hypothetical protein
MVRKPCNPKCLSNHRTALDRNLTAQRAKIIPPPQVLDGLNNHRSNLDGSLTARRGKMIPKVGW